MKKQWGTVKTNYGCTHYITKLRQRKYSYLKSLIYNTGPDITAKRICMLSGEIKYLCQLEKLMIKLNKS